MQLCPLGTGNVPWEEIAVILKQTGFDGPVSFYGSGGAPNSDQNLRGNDLVAQLGSELSWFQHMMKTDSKENL